MKKINLTFGWLCTIFMMFYSCNSQVNIDKTRPQHKEKSYSDKKLELDPKATVIHQDKKNNLWFASEDKGVYTYDGENLTLFTSMDGLTSTRIISVQEDQAGYLYFDTPEGVFKYNGEKFTTLTFAPSKKTQKKWTSAPEDLWFRIGWDNKGPYRYDGKNLHLLEFPKNEMEDEFYRKYPNASFNPYAIYSVYKDSKSHVWFGTAYLGLYLFDGKKMSWMFETQLTEVPGGGDFGIRSMIEDKNGNYWICNADYRYTISPNNLTTDTLQSIIYTRQVGIENITKKNLYFYSMETDDDGNIFMFAKESGLWLNDGTKLTEFFIKDGDQDIMPTSMYKDNQGKFWFGTDQHGIYKYDGSSFEKFRIKS